MADYPSTPTSSAPPLVPPPPHSRRLMRSARERMWAGVAGGMAEFFDIDPSLVRLLWVAAAVVTGGLAIPAYILLWIILPRDDRPPVGNPGAWRDWSEEFHNETRRVAEEARRASEEMRQRGQSWRAPGPTEPPPPATEPAQTPVPTEDEWWRSERYMERPRGH